MNKIFSISVFSILTLQYYGTRKRLVQTAGRTQLGEFAPKFAELKRRCPLWRGLEPHRQTRSA